MLPNPIHPEKGSLAYAKPQVSEVMAFSDFVQHIADHGGYTRGKVKGVISDMCSCLVEMLLEGKKVMLEELGDFWVSLSSVGAESIEAFTENNITALNIIYTPGPDFENLVSKAKFGLVASRAAQAATLKAEKTGKTTVDLEAAKKKPTSNKEEGTGDNKPSGNGDGNQTGGNTQAGGNTQTGDNTQTGGSENAGSTGSEDGNGDNVDL